MKIIHITEGILNNIKNNEKVILPKFIFNKLKSHTTSLGNNDVFPPDNGFPFDYVITKKRFLEVKKNVEAYDYESMDKEFLNTKLSKLLSEVKRLEKPIKPQLEALAENAIYRLFAIPKNMINFSFRLVDKVSGYNIRILPEEDEKSGYTFDSISSILLTNKEIAKRRVINSLIQGASTRLIENQNNFIDELNDLNPELYFLYKEVIDLTEYLLFLNKEVIYEDSKNLGSYVSVRLNSKNERSTIDVQGLIFPFLYREAIRGVLELATSYGLPHDREKAMYIINKSDFIMAEPWDMRLGVGMWDLLIKNINNELSDVMPYLLKLVSEMDVNSFNENLKEIFGQTTKGENIIQDIITNIQNNEAYNNFNNNLEKNDIDKTVINDSYFSAADLDVFNLEDTEVVESN